MEGDLAEGKNEFVKAIGEWFRERVGERLTDNRRYVACAALAVLERMRERFPLLPGDYVTKGGQVRTSKALIKKVLARFGESRLFADEGGRTTRGTLVAAEELVERLHSLQCANQISQLGAQERQGLISAAQELIVGYVREYLEQQRLQVPVDPAKPICRVLDAILDVARGKGLGGPVAQHLVGAKLALRFPDREIPNHSYTAADRSTGRPGDFVVGDTVFHVTVAPTLDLFQQKCERNLQNRYRVKVVVPEDQVAAAVELARQSGVVEDVEVLPLERFIGPNVEEIGGFTQQGITDYLRILLETYNRRVEEAERNPSLLVDIPANLSSVR